VADAVHPRRSQPVAIGSAGCRAGANVGLRINEEVVTDHLANGTARPR
jgi:hypothetical protein